MENLTTTQFLQLASMGFSCGFVTGLALWGVRCATRFVSLSLTGRSSIVGE